MIQIQVFLQTKTILLEAWYNPISLTKIISSIFESSNIKVVPYPIFSTFKPFYYLYSYLWTTFPVLLLGM